MQALGTERSPLDVCLEHLQHTPGPAVNSENAAALAARLQPSQATLQACARLILRDLGLTLRLLRIANSAMFSLGGKTVVSVTHAAALLGTDALAQILESVTRSALRHPVRELVGLSHLTAVVAGALMNRTEPRFAEEAYIAGLFRNMGEVCFALEQPGEYGVILAASQSQMVGLRASCRSHAHFEFDELTAGLLGRWAFHGAPTLAAQSTPEALFAQQGAPDADIALAACVAHLLVTAHFRCDFSEREKMMRPYWGLLAKQYFLREKQVAELCELAWDSLGNLRTQMDLTAERLRLRTWMPAAPEPVRPLPPAILPPDATLAMVLETAIQKGMDRAAWLPYADPEIHLGAAAGIGWPGEGAVALTRLIQPRKPPYLLAFAQRQDVWIDFGKDQRFRESPLAREMRPAVFFLLPVYEGRKVRGCLYFDWALRPDHAPETVLPALSALRDFIGSNMPAA